MPNPLDALHDQTDAIGAAVTALDAELVTAIQQTQTVFKKFDEWITETEIRLTAIEGVTLNAPLVIQEIRDTLDVHNSRLGNLETIGILDRLTTIDSRLLALEPPIVYPEEGIED